MGILSWVRNRFAGDEKAPAPGDDFWYEPIGGNSSAGIKVSADIALKASAVFACIKVLAETIASLDLRIYQETSLGQVEAANHPLTELIRFQPNVWQTAVEFWEMMMLHAALRGTAYAEIKPGPRGAVDQLWPLHKDRVKPEQLRDGSLRFVVTNWQTGQTKTLLQDEVFRLPGLSSDGIEGLRAVDIAAEAIGLGIAADNYAARVFSNRLNMGGFLIHPGKLSPDGQKNLVNALMERLAGPQNVGRPMVLQEGMKFEKAAMDADEAQLLEARKWQIAEVARFWRIPLHMLNVYDGVTRANVEQQSLEFIMYTLIPWTNRIVQAIRRDLIIAKQSFVAAYDFSSLLKGDSAARSDYLAKALGSGGGKPWMSQDEARAFEGLPRLGGAYAVLDTKVGQAPAKPQLPPPGAAIPNNDPLLAAARLQIKRENAAIRKAAMRFADDHDAFRNWVSAYFGSQASHVADTLGVPVDAARAYCAGSRDQIVTANDLEGLLVQREDTGAQSIADAITQWREH